MGCPRLREIPSKVEYEEGPGIKAVTSGSRNLCVRRDCKNQVAPSADERLLKWVIDEEHEDIAQPVCRHCHAHRNPNGGRRNQLSRDEVRYRPASDVVADAHEDEGDEEAEGRPVTTTYNQESVP